MNTSGRWWIALIVAVVGCGPVNYWVGSYASGLSDMFPTIMPATKRYEYAPGYDPSPPVPRSGPVNKKAEEKPLPGVDPADDATAGEAPAGSEPPAANAAPSEPAAAAAPVPTRP